MSSQYPCVVLAVLVGIFLTTPLTVIAQEPVEDTLDWRGYFPLEVGNEWVYHITDYNDRFPSLVDTTYYESWTVKSDSLIDEKTYYVLRTCGYTPEKDFTDCECKLVRYDAVATTIRHRVYNEGTYFDGWWYMIPCRLDAAFGSETFCGNGHFHYTVQGGYDSSYTFGADTLRTAEKFFVSNVSDTRTMHGLGIARYRSGDPSISFEQRLVYAKVGDKTYGDNPIASHSEALPEPSSDLTITTLYPNPFRRSFTIDFTMPVAQQTSLSIYDVLGRRVRYVPLGLLRPGQHEHSFTVDDLAAGTYIVRIEIQSGQRAMRKVVAVY